MGNVGCEIGKYEMLMKLYNRQREGGREREKESDTRPKHKQKARGIDVVGNECESRWWLAK